MSDLRSRATNPHQYDLPDLHWDEDARTPMRLFFLEAFLGYESHWMGKDVLDVGAGTGWLLEEIKKTGAKSVFGLEPSAHNVAMAKKLVPDIDMVQSSFEDFQTSQTFDVIVCIMTFPHLGDLEATFKKMCHLLKPSGELFAIIPDFEYYRQPRHKYEIEFQDVSENEFVLSVKRPFGTLVDIVRKIPVYAEAAKRNGFTSVEAIPMKPTADLLERLPQYLPFKDTPITHVMQFQK